MSLIHNVQALGAYHWNLTFRLQSMAANFIKFKTPFIRPIRIKTSLIHPEFLRSCEPLCCSVVYFFVGLFKGAAISAARDVLS